MWRGMSLETAGEAPYFLATNSDLKNVTGSYFDMQKETNFPPNVTDLKKRAELSEKILEWIKK